MSEPNPPRGSSRGRRRTTYRLAVCSVFCALGTVMLGLGALVELIDITCAALAAVLFLPVFYRYGDVYKRQVYYLSEQSFLHHVHDHHFHLSVAAVFQQHEGCSGSLLRAHQPPAVLNRVRAADLHADRNPLLHCLIGDGKMRFPCRHDQHRIDALRIERRMPIRRRKGCLLYTSSRRCWASTAATGCFRWYPCLPRRRAA